MKSMVRKMKRAMVLIATLLLASPLLFADGESTGIFLSGSSNTWAGDYVIQSTQDVFHYQGRVFEVYRVSYDNPEMNMKIAVNTEGPCRFVAYNGEFSFFYVCNEYGFGVRKVMFNNPWEQDRFSNIEYNHQSILRKKHKIDKTTALGMIATYMPSLIVM
jgi:hypothetical protein